MRKYTSKTEKIAKYSAKYNISETEAYRILTEHEDVLTLEELKIKYDNPNIGKLPEWLSEEDLSNMIWNTIHHNWSTIFEQRMTKEELFSEHQEYIRKKIGLYENHSHIKAALIKRMITLANEYTRKGKYFIGSTDETFDTASNVVRYKYEGSTSDDNLIDDTFFIQKIRNIKNKEIKNLLIIAGYLMCDITELRKDYLQLLRSYDNDIKSNIAQLESIIKTNDDINRAKVDGIKLSKGRKKTIKITDIIKATRFHENLGTTLADSLEELKCYLIVTNIV